MLNLFLYKIFSCVHSLVLYIASKNILILEPVGNIFNVFRNLFEYYSFKFQCTKVYINVLIDWWLELIGVLNNISGMTVNINASNSSNASIIGGVIGIAVTIGYYVYRFFRKKEEVIKNNNESDLSEHTQEERLERIREREEGLNYNPVEFEP